MLTEDDFYACAEALAKANYLAIELAAECTSLIGDTPELAPEGKVIGRSYDDRELARLVFP